MGPAGLSRQAPPNAGRASPALWAGRFAVGVAAVAVGSALGQAGDPLRLVVLALVAGLAIAAAVARLRWCLVAALFLLVAYVPDALAGDRSRPGADRRPRHRRAGAVGQRPGAPARAP